MGFLFSTVVPEEEAKKYSFLVRTFTGNDSTFVRMEFTEPENGRFALKKDF
jgi:hypothetical protein